MFCNKIFTKNYVTKLFKINTFTNAKSNNMFQIKDILIKNTRCLPLSFKDIYNQKRISTNTNTPMLVSNTKKICDCNDICKYEMYNNNLIAYTTLEKIAQASFVTVSTITGIGCYHTGILGNLPVSYYLTILINYFFFTVGISSAQVYNISKMNKYKNICKLKK